LSFQGTLRPSAICLKNAFSVREDTMIKNTLAGAALLMLCSAPLQAQQLLHDAISAALGEAVEDARYASVLANYGLPVPNKDTTPNFANSKDNPYPDVAAGTLLDQVLTREELRID
jgi:hypothetical protein